MKDKYSDESRKPYAERESSKRMLRKLRILLIIWLLSFLITIIWFAISARS